MGREITATDINSGPQGCSGLVNNKALYRLLPPRTHYRDDSVIAKQVNKIEILTRN
jgi:hypothetical protein